MNKTFNEHEVNERINNILGDVPVQYAVILEHQTLIFGQLEAVKSILQKRVKQFF